MGKLHKGRSKPKRAQQAREGAASSAPTGSYPVLAPPSGAVAPLLGAGGGLLQLSARFCVTVNTMIAYEDFVPKRLRKQGFIKPPLYETFQDAVDAAGAWIKTQEATIVSIETVVLPGLWNQQGLQSNAAKLGDGTASTYPPRELYQFVRVWYTTS